jgi:hypothetical protein
VAANAAGGDFASGTITINGNTGNLTIVVNPSYYE